MKRVLMQGTGDQDQGCRQTSGDSDWLADVPRGTVKKGDNVEE
jgi:hypothetical protein